MSKRTKAADAELASRYKCTRRTIANWRKESAPLDDPVKMEKWLAARTRVPVGLEPTTLTDARLHKVLAETRRLNFELGVRRGEFLLAADVKRDLFAIGSATRAALLRLPGEIPTWEGLPAAELEKRAQKLADEIIAHLHDPDSYRPVS